MSLVVTSGVGTNTSTGRSLFPRHELVDHAPEAAILSFFRLAIGHERRTLLGELSLELKAGQTLALVGGNGSGKTTLLRTIGGLIPPLGGSISILGRAPRDAGRYLAWLGQFHPANPLLPLRVIDAVRMARFPERGLFRPFNASDKNLVDEALDFVGMADSRKKTLGLLSGGQRQKVFLAYVLARQAPLILLDEPLQNLDSEGDFLVTEALRRWKAAGTSIVMATHDLHEAGRADLVLSLPSGRVEMTNNVGI